MNEHEPDDEPDDVIPKRQYSFTTLRTRQLIDILFTTFSAAISIADV